MLTQRGLNRKGLQRHVGFGERAPFPRFHISTARGQANKKEPRKERQRSKHVALFSETGTAS